MHWLTVGAGAFFLGAVFGGLAVAAAAKSVPRGIVTGIGGVFIKAKDPQKLADWYSSRLGIAPSAEGTSFLWREADAPDKLGRTVWSLFPQTTDYFGRSDQQVMINYRVDDLDALLAKLKTMGVEHIGKIEAYDFGRFAWVLDGEGNRVELWQPLESAAP